MDTKHIVSIQERTIALIELVKKAAHGELRPDQLEILGAKVVLAKGTLNHLETLKVTSKGEDLVKVDNTIKVIQQLLGLYDRLHLNKAA